MIRREIGREDADVHFICRRTQTNLITIGTALKPWQAVICLPRDILMSMKQCDKATGHKVLAMPGKNES